MSYSFQHEESIDTNIKRVYTELLDQCIYRLTNSYGKSHSAVHETRKCFKKMRALFRLVRYEIGEDIYQAYNIFFREEGRKISALRDVNVLIETLDDLKNTYQDTLSDDVFTGIRANLLRKKHALSKKLLYRKKVLQKIFARLEEAEAYLPPLHIQNDDFSVFREGLSRVYKKGSKGLATVYAERSVRNFHDWRKRMKYLRYQTDLLSPAWPSVMSLQEKELHHLTDILGNHHDLSVLEDEILKINIANQEVLDILLGLIHQRKTALEEEALPLGAKLFAEKPKSFVNRLETYWSIWKSNTHKENPQEVAIVS
jgi:CHAD domain-containing protein